MACCTECDEGKPCAGDCPGCDEMEHENPCEAGACELPRPNPILPTADGLAGTEEALAGEGGKGTVSPAQTDQAVLNFQTELARVRAEGVAEGSQKATVPAFFLGAAVGATLLYVLVRWKVIKG